MWSVKGASVVHLGCKGRALLLQAPCTFTASAMHLYCKGSCIYHTISIKKRDFIADYIATSSR